MLNNADYEEICTAAPPRTVRIFQYDGCILLYPFVEPLDKELSLTEKELQTVRGVSKIVFKKLRMYELVQRNGKEVCVAFQGFIDRILRCLLRNGYAYQLTDKRIMRMKKDGIPAPRFDLTYGFRFSQKELLMSALLKDRSGLIGAPTRYGKCHTKGTKIVMADYSLKNVEDLKVKDKVLGVDGQPRRIAALGRGREQMYRIIPSRGEPFGVNASHIMHLQTNIGGKLETINITMKMFLRRPTFYQEHCYLIYMPVDFNEKALPCSPAWAGQALADEEAPWGKEKYFQRTDGSTYIPLKFLASAKHQRVKMLESMLYNGGVYDPVKNTYTLKFESEELIRTAIRLCRGLGLSTERKDIKGEYSDDVMKGLIIHMGDTGGNARKLYDMHPTQHLETFKVEDLGEGDYYGFELEGEDFGDNKLYLLEDHCVQHNTTLIVNTLRAFPTLPTVVTAPGVDLVTQLYEDITGERGVEGREVKLICTGSRTKHPSETGITVCSADSLQKCNTGTTRLLLADEPHALVTNGRARDIDAFQFARRYGFGATLTGRFDNRDKLIEGLFGSVLAERTYTQAVKEGAICPLEIIFLRIPLRPERYYRDRNAAYDDLFFRNEDMAQITRKICHEVIPPDFQTLVFIKHEKQAELYLHQIGEDGTIAMAKRLTKGEREEVNRLMKANVIKRCLCSKIYVQGVTFSDVRVLINCEAGGNNTSAIQKPGRLAEIRPGKKCGIVIDFLFEPADDLAEGGGDSSWMALCADSNNRKKAYKDKGYSITEVASIEELKAKFSTLV